MRGQTFAIHCTAVISTIMMVSVARADSVVVDRGTISGLQAAIYQADQRSDFAVAVHTAEECIAITKGSATPVGDEAGNPFCIQNLSDALRDGSGLRRDDARAG